MLSRLAVAHFVTRIQWLDVGGVCVKYYQFNSIRQSHTLTVGLCGSVVAWFITIIVNFIIYTSKHHHKHDWSSGRTTSVRPHYKSS